MSTRRNRTDLHLGGLAVIPHHQIACSGAEGRVLGPARRRSGHASACVQVKEFLKASGARSQQLQQVDRPVVSSIPQAAMLWDNNQEPVMLAAHPALRGQRQARSAARCCTLPRRCRGPARRPQVAPAAPSAVPFDQKVCAAAAALHGSRLGSVIFPGGCAGCAGRGVCAIHEMNQPTRWCSKAIDVLTHVLGAEVLWRKREDRLQRLIILRNLRFSKPNMGR